MLRSTLLPRALRGHGLAIAVLAGAVLSVLGGVGSASATQLCVQAPHCHGHRAVSVVSAVSRAGANGPGRDRIVVGPGRFAGSVVSSETNRVSIVGSGSRTVLIGTGPRPTALPAADCNFSLGRQSRLARLTFESGIDRSSTLCLTAVTADRIDVRTRGAFSIGVVGSDAGLLARSSVVSASLAFLGYSGSSAVEDSRLVAPTGADARTDNFGPSRDVTAPPELSIRRSRISATGDGARDVKSVSDSLIFVRGGGSGVRLDNCAATGLTVTNDTITGDGSAGSTGVDVTDAGGFAKCARSPDLTVTGSILRSLATDVRTQQGGPPSEDNIKARVGYSDFDPARVSSNRPGQVQDQGNNVNVDPRFVDGGRGDLHLRFDSPLVGAGEPARDLSLGGLDVDGHRRVVDADHDGHGEVDMGAHEYQGSGPHPVIAISNRRPYVFQDTRFNGLRSSDPDGGGLTYRWEFGDRRTAIGPRVSHHYTEAGVYRIYLTVRDYQGLRSFTTRTINVKPAPIVCGHRC